MARRLRAALGLILLASTGLQVSASTSLFVRFFGPISSGCAISGTGVTAGEKTAAGGVKTGSTCTAAITVAMGQTPTSPDECIDTFTGLAFPFSLGGYAVSSSTTQVNAVCNIAVPGSGTAEAAYDAIGDLIDGTPTSDQITDFTTVAWATSSVYALMNGDAAHQKDGKKILKADLQFIALAQAAAAAFLSTTSGAYPTTGDCQDIDDIVAFLAAKLNAAQASTPLDLTVAADINTVLTYALGDTAGCDVADATMATLVTDTSNVVKAVKSLAEYAETLANYADATASAWDVAHLAGLAAYLSSFNTSTPLPFASIAADTTKAALIANVNTALQTYVNDDQILAILSALGVQNGGSDYTVASWDTTVYAQNIGPITGAALTYTPFNRLSATTLAATDATTGGVSVTDATLGLYTIPQGSKDLILATDGSVTTSVPLTGIAPMPDQTLSGTDTYSIYMGPINALMYAANKQGQGSAITLPDPADWQTTYEDILGASDVGTPQTLPAGNYLTRTLDSGNEWRGSYAAFAVYIADVMLSNTATLATVFLDNACAHTNYDRAAITALVFDQLVGLHATAFTTGNTIRDAIRAVYNTIADTADIGTTTQGETNFGLMAAAILNVNTLALGYLPATDTTWTTTWATATTAGRPTPDQWYEVTQLARLAQKDMVAAFASYGIKFKAYVDSASTAFATGVPTDITAAYVTNLDTAAIQAVTGVNKAFLATTHSPAEGFVRFFGPVSSGCAVTYGSDKTGQASTTLGKSLVVGPDATYGSVVITSSATCVDAFTGAAFPYPAAGYANYKFQVSSTNTISNQLGSGQTAKASYNQLGLSDTAGASDGITANTWTSVAPMWEYTSVYDNMKAGYTVLGKRLLGYDLKFMATSVGFLAATNGLSSLSTNCGTTAKLHAALAKAASGAASLDMSDTTKLSALYSSTQTTCTTAELPTATLTASVNTDNNLAAVKKLVDLADTIVSEDDNTWVLNDLAAMAHYSAYLSGTIDLASIKSATTTSLLAAISNTTVMPSAIATALLGSYSAKDTDVKAFAVGPVSGVQMTYQPFHAMAASALVDANNAALTTDTTGTVTAPGATHGLYTIPAGATDMFLSTDGEAVTTWVPLTGVTTFASTDNTITKDTAYLSPGSAFVWSKFKRDQNQAAYGSHSVVPTTPAAGDWETAYEAILTGTSLPAGNYYTRKFTSGTYAGSNAALAIFGADLLLSNIATLGGLYINNVLATSATNTIDAIVSSLYDAMAAPAGGGTPSPKADLADSTAINTILTAAWTAANGGTGPVASSKDESGLALIADAIAAVNTKVKTDIIDVAAAASLSSHADEDLWIEVVQIAKVVNYKMAPDVKSVAASVKAASSWTTALSDSVTAKVVTPYSSTTLDTAVTNAVLNLTAVANVVGPLKGYSRFFGPVSDGCKVMFSDTTQPQWTKDGAVIAIKSETVTVNYNSSYPCKDTFTGKAVPFPVSGWAPAGTGAGDYFQISAVNTIASQKNSVATAYASYTALGLPGTDADGGIATGDWTANRKWETASVWTNLQSTSTAVRGAKRLLALDLQFIALSVASAAAIQAADTSSQLKTGCKTVAELQAALAKYAGGTALQMDTAAHIGTILSGIQSTCGNTNFPPAVLTAANVAATQSAILRLVTVGAQLANTGDNGWVLHDVINMVRFASYVSDAVTLSADAATHTAAVATASIDVSAITTALNIDYAEKDTLVTVLGLGVLNGTKLTYQRFYDMNATDLATSTDEMGLVEVANATHALYTIPAGMVDTLLTNDTSSPVLTLVPWTGVSGFTGATGRVVINPAAALVYARMRASNTLNVPSAGSWTSMYQNLMGSGVTLPVRDYQSRADETLLGSYASLAVLAADVILQSTPALGGLFITNAVGGNTNIATVVKKIFDEVYDADATDLSTGSYILSALTAVWTDVAGAAPTTNQTAVLTSISNAIAASNGAANAVLTVAVTKFSTNTMQDFATWKSVVQVAKVHNDMASPILTIAAAVYSNSTSVVQDVVKMVETPYTGTNLTAAVAAAAVNDDAVRHAAGLGRTANARFFGPLAAGCTVAYAVTTTPTTSMLGEVTATAMEQLTVAKCQDTFTGKTTPWDVIGYSLDQFQLSATTSISAKHSTGTMDHTSRFAYGQLGITADDVNVTDWFKDRKLESSDLLQLFAMGDITVPKKLLQKDLGFMALSAGVVSAVLAADTTGSLKTGCKTASELQQALSKYIANLADGSPAAQVNLGVDTPATVVSAAFTGLQSVCSTGNVSAAIPAAVLSAAASTANVAAITALVNSAFLLEDNSQWPLWQMASFAHLASYMSDALVLSGADFKSEDNLGAAINASTINPEGICAAMGVEGYAAHDLDVVPAFAGPLSGVNASYLAFTQIVESNMADDKGLLHIPGATHAIYTFNVGAVFTFLTTDATKPVKTLVPITGITGFPGPGPRTTVGPINSLVWQMFEQGEGIPIHVPAPDMWRHAYETLVGAALPPNDYHTRNYTKDSATGLAVFAIDMVLPALPTLGSLLINASLPQTSVELGIDLEMVLRALYEGLIDASLKDLSDADKVTLILLDVYTTLTGVEVTTNSTARRILLDTGATMSAILSNIGAALADSNAMAGDVLKTAMAAIANGTAVDPSLFTQLVKIASVQNVNLAAAVQDIASKIAAGQLDAALNASAVAKDAFTGTNLMAAVAAAKVNDAAISAALLPDPGTPGATATTSSSDSSSSSKTLAIGLGVGLGVGIPLVVGIGAAVFMSIKKRRAMQTTTPAPPA